MAERVFLTPRRREILRGSSDEADESARVAKYKLRNRVKLAVDELIEVGESDGLANEDIVTPNQLRRLIMALFGDHREIPPYYEAWNESGEALAEYIEEYEYERSLAEVIDHMHTLYADLLLKSDPPRSAGERDAEAKIKSAFDWGHFRETGELRVDSEELESVDLPEGVTPEDINLIVG